MLNLDVWFGLLSCRQLCLHILAWLVGCCSSSNFSDFCFNTEELRRNGEWWLELRFFWKWWKSVTHALTLDWDWDWERFRSAMEPQGLAQFCQKAEVFVSSLFRIYQAKLGSELFQIGRDLEVPWNPKNLHNFARSMRCFTILSLGAPIPPQNLIFFCKNWQKHMY